MKCKPVLWFPIHVDNMARGKAIYESTQENIIVGCGGACE
jgi:hypothetical protein